MFRFRHHHSKRVSQTQLGTTYFNKEVPHDGMVETVYFRHVPDDTVLPELPSAEDFSLEACLASGKNLNQVNSNVLSPSDPLTGEALVESIINVNPIVE